MSETVEVILCTYNGSRFVIEQIKSILAQTTRIDRLSIYDDASHDGTPDLIARFAASLDPEKNILHLEVNKENIGYAHNFCNAIQRASCDIILLCDQDDIWESDKVAVLVKALHDDSSDMAFSDGTLINSSGAPIPGPTVLGAYGLDSRAVTGFRHQAFKLLIKRNFINGAALAVRRKAAQAAMPVPEHMPHDYWLAIWCALNAGITGIPKPLYRYRQHENNAIGVGTTKTLHVIAGLWRHPDIPRQVELLRWRHIVPRISLIPNHPEINNAREKLFWLESVLDHKPNRLTRMATIIGSAISGRYLKYSPPYSFIRDLISTVKSKSPH